MPYTNVPAFTLLLQRRNAVSALALEFLILTAARTGEVFGATWGEINLETEVWTIPAVRMKAGRLHRVPLSDRAIAILQKVALLRGSDSATEYIFPGSKRGRPLSNMALTQLMRRMGIVDSVPHGFRSSFRDWCGECTNHPREIAEAALAHVIGSAVEQAYRRGDALEKRRLMMLDWAGFIGSEAKLS